MREVLRGERGWEREIPGTAALSSPDPVTVLDPRGGARDGEVVARATLLDAAPRRGLHTPAREREREWEREREGVGEAFTLAMEGVRASRVVAG